MKNTNCNSNEPNKTVDDSIVTSSPEFQKIYTGQEDSLFHDMTYVNFDSGSTCGDNCDNSKILFDVKKLPITTKNSEKNSGKNS